ncbi:MAG: two-component system response regulator [Gemmatimonadetes bacterium]|nr:two-component system response regulator [Gemmatimonadota bacterium]
MHPVLARRHAIFQIRGRYRPATYPVPEGWVTAWCPARGAAHASRGKSDNCEYPLPHTPVSTHGQRGTVPRRYEYCREQDRGSRNSKRSEATMHETSSTADLAEPYPNSEITYAQEDRRKRVKLRVLVSRNPRMQAVLARLDRIAASDATVLVQGESGTGKEVIAETIHNCSHRGSRSFVSINCGALPDGLLESELFGHEKGAFTGAYRQRAGKFELAHGGTLFLDEIGSADEKTQRRLLRVLQEHSFERLGGTRTLKVDVRVVAATNANLKTEMKEGRFREDLYYRLSVLPLDLPPLRERREDIPLFIDHFLEGAALSNGRQGIGILPAASALLAAYPWPGNIRQLENVLTQMVVMAGTGPLAKSDIPDEIQDWRDDEVLPESTALSYWEARVRFERSFLCRALRRHNGVIAHVAEAIGVSRKHLYVRMDQLEIDYGRFRPAP